ncbi:hypothetical protein G6F56_009186 [Rhizopus delemar]|nr:hypothetical protein G6F56_009186 [Rhizopus delemar]
MTFDFEERQGDLLESTSPTDSIVFTMTEDMKLTNKEIRSRLGQPQVQKKKVGQVAVQQQQKRFIFYLILKPKSYNKPSYGHLETCLIELRKACETFGVQSLAIPRELEEGLQDKYVKQALFDVFQDFSHLASHCESIQSIPSSEYAARHRRLYETLIDLDHQGFLMEGGATMRYYTNIDWELTERPFLILLLRNDTLETGIQMVLFSPTFESTKAAKKLEEAKLPASIHHQILTWDEHQSPFDLVQSAVKDSKILVESNTRLFIFEGLERLLKIKMAPVSIRQLRMIKSEAELAILRCANEVTQMAIEAVRPFIKVGMNEREIQGVMTKALVAAGLTQTWVLALVDQDAALPHGDSGERQVQKKSVVLIDTGGELHGYQSDTTRTFFMAPKGFNQTIENVWYLVKEAQESVLNQISVGNTAAQVDLTARDVIEKAGYGPYFTHRLGHGIGLEMHEEPYMNKGNTELVLKPGMTFSVE